MRQMEIVFRRQRAGSYERAERLEIMFCVLNLGLGNCPSWFLPAFDDCERTGSGPCDHGRYSARTKEWTS